MTQKKSLSTYIVRGIIALVAVVALYIPTAHAIRISDVRVSTQPVTQDQAIVNQTTTQQPVQDVSRCSLGSFSNNASNDTVKKWDSATLTWGQSGCTSLTLSSSDGSFTGTSVADRTSVSTGALTNSTSYVLSGTGEDGAVAQRTVTINVVNSTTSTPCQIYYFNANESSYIQIYSGQSANLTWNTSNGCSNISIAGNNGAYFGGLGNQSNISVGPFSNTTVYTLTAYDSTGNTQTLQAVVGVKLGTEAGTSYGNYNNYNYNNGNTWTNYSGNNYGYNSGNYSGNNCVINSFQPSSYYITSGQTVTFTWSTVGCYSLLITAPSGSFPTYYYLPPSGSMQTNALYGTSNFTLTANGSNSTAWPPVTVYVAGGPYPYTTNQSSGTSAISGVASNVGAYSVRLNGVALANTSPTTAWFEYGIGTQLESRTGDQNFAPGSTMVFYDTMYTTPGTTYYYRAVTQSNGVVSRGSLMTVVTKESSDDVVYVQSRTVSGGATATSTTAGPTVTVTDGSDKVYIGDTVDVKINYANGTNKKLSNVKLNIVLPQGFTVRQTTKGQMVSPTMVTVDIGTLVPGQTDSVFVQAKVENTVSLSSTLVTNVTMSFKYPNGVSDSAVGYALNHAVGVSALGGFALGAGFFPTTILGWIVTVLIILAVILTIRRLSKAKHGGGHGAVHH